MSRVAEPITIGSSPRERRRQAKTEHILKAATEIFLEEGYSTTSVDKIVERAGVSKRTLYNRYRSKAEIFVDIMKQQYEGLFALVDVSSYPRSSVEKDLYLLGVNLLTMSSDRLTIALFRSIAGEAQRFPELGRDFLEELFERVAAEVSKILNAGVRSEGWGVPDLREAAGFFLDNLTGTAFFRVIFGTAPPMDRKAIEARAKRAAGLFAAIYRTAADAPRARKARKG